MAGLRSRNKGKQGEREAAAELTRLFGVEARRGCQYAGGPDSPDIQTSIPGVHFEIKRSERLRLYEAIVQAAQDAPVNTVPVVLYRANNKPWLVVLQLNDLQQVAVQLYLQMASR